MNTIACPHCGKNVEITQALTHELEEKILKQQEEKHRQEVELAKKEARLEAEKHVKEKIEKELKSSEFEKKKLGDELFRLQKGQEKLKIEAKKQAEEEMYLRLKEKDKQIEDAKEAARKATLSNEELKRKLEQGSEQRQGEVLELDMEEKLKSNFPYDSFLPIPKGFEGADIWQEVKNKYGNSAGSILWETKRTKNFSRQWLVKLREDTRKINATESILVTQVLPVGTTCFKRIEGVWVTSYEYAMQIAEFVRFCMLSVAIAKASASHKEEDLKMLYDYINSDAFRHKIQAHYELVNALREDQLAEKRSTELRWKKRESYIAKLDRNTTQMYGELQSVIPNLPSIGNMDTALNGPRENLEE